MPNALFEPSPTVSADDTANHVGANAKYVTELSLIISALWIYAANFAHVGLRKSGIVVRLAACRDQKFRIVRMLGVCTGREVFEIFRSVIVLASILMVNLAAFGSITNKGKGHQMMDASGRLFAVTRKGDDEVATRGNARTKNGALDPAPDLGYVRQATDPAQVAYLVNGGKKWIGDIRPNFFNHVISLRKNTNMPIIPCPLMGSNMEVCHR